MACRALRGRDVKRGCLLAVGGIGVRPGGDERHRDVGVAVAGGAMQRGRAVPVGPVAWGAGLQEKRHDICPVVGGRFMQRRPAGPVAGRRGGPGLKETSHAFEVRSPAGCHMQGPAARPGDGGRVGPGIEQEPDGGRTGGGAGEEQRRHAAEVARVDIGPGLQQHLHRRDIPAGGRQMQGRGPRDVPGPHRAATGQPVAQGVTRGRAERQPAGFAVAAGLLGMSAGKGCNAVRQTGYLFEGPLGRIVPLNKGVQPAFRAAGMVQADLGAIDLAEPVGEHPAVPWVDAERLRALPPEGPRQGPGYGLARFRAGRVVDREDIERFSPGVACPGAPGPAVRSREHGRDGCRDLRLDIRSVEQFRGGRGHGRCPRAQAIGSASPSIVGIHENSMRCQSASASATRASTSSGVSSRYRRSPSRSAPRTSAPSKLEPE